jgi:hypothetical protein
VRPLPWSSTGYRTLLPGVLPLNRIVQGTLPEQYKLASGRDQRMRISYIRLKLT